MIKNIYKTGESNKDFKVGTLVASYEGEHVTASYKFFKNSNTERYMVGCLKDMASAMINLKTTGKGAYDDKIRKNLVTVSFTERPMTEQEYADWLKTEEWKKKSV